MIERKREPALLAAAIVSVLLAVSAAAVFFVLLHSRAADPSVKYLQLGQEYLEELKYDDAVLAFREAVKIDPKSADGYWGLAAAYRGQANEAVTVDWERSQLERSAEAYQKVIELQPDREEAYYSIVDVYFAQSDSFLDEDPEKAAEYLEAAEALLRELPEDLAGSETAGIKQEEATRRRVQIDAAKQSFPAGIRVHGEGENREYAFHFSEEEQTLYVETDAGGYPDHHEVFFSMLGDRARSSEGTSLTLLDWEFADGLFHFVQHPLVQSGALKTVCIQSADYTERWVVEQSGDGYFAVYSSTWQIPGNTEVERDRLMSEFRFDNNGFCIRESIRGGLGERALSVDELGHVLAYHTYSEGEDERDCVIERDADGRIRTVTEQLLWTDGRSETEYYTYLYDENGEIIDIENSLKEQLHSFSYDEKGRLLSYRGRTRWFDVSYEEEPWWADEEPSDVVSGSSEMWNTYRMLADNWLEAYKRFSEGEASREDWEAGYFDHGGIDGAGGCLSYGVSYEPGFALEDLNQDGQAELIMLDSSWIIDIFCWHSDGSWYNITPGGRAMYLYANGVVESEWGHGNHDYIYYRYSGGTQMEEITSYYTAWNESYTERELHDESGRVVPEDELSDYLDSLGEREFIKYPATQENLDHLQRGRTDLLSGGFV